MNWQPLSDITWKEIDNDAPLLVSSYIYYDGFHLWMDIACCKSSPDGLKFYSLYREDLIETDFYPEYFTRIDAPLENFGGKSIPSKKQIADFAKLKNISELASAATLRKMYVSEINAILGTKPKGKKNGKK